MVKDNNLIIATFFNTSLGVSVEKLISVNVKASASVHGVQLFLLLITVRFLRGTDGPRDIFRKARACAMVSLRYRDVRGYSELPPDTFCLQTVV